MTFDEHLFFSQDDLDKVRVPTQGAMGSLRGAAENAGASRDAGEKETDPSSSA